MTVPVVLARCVGIAGSVRFRRDSSSQRRGYELSAAQRSISLYATFIPYVRFGMICCEFFCGFRDIDH
jgi:hypothetical protein